MSRRVRNGVALGMLAAIGALFVYKYGYRVSEAAGYAAVGYTVLFAGGAALAWMRAGAWDGARPGREGKSGWFGAMAGLLVAAAVVMGTLWPEGGEVARLPALAVWWERVFAGMFPYGPPIRPSGLPGLFGLVLPFYLTGLLQYLPALGLAVFVLVVARGVARPVERMAVLVTVAALPTTWYEALLQSELFLNVALALAGLLAVERMIGQAMDRGEELGFGRVLAAGGLLGVLLSTRLIVAVIFGMYFAYRFRGQYGRGLGIAAAAVAAFVLTLVPLLVWDAQQFVAEGPFAVQSLYLPSALAVGIVVGALVLAARSRIPSEVLFYQGAVLFVLAAASLVLTVQRMGAAEAVLESGFDLTYFVFSVPLLLLSLTSFSFRSADAEPATSRRG